MKVLNVMLLSFLSGCSFEESQPPDTVFSTEWEREVRLEPPVLVIGVYFDGGGPPFMTWSRPEGADYFTLEQDILPEFTTPLTIQAGPDSTYSIPPDTLFFISYYYRVRAENQLFISDWSNVVVFP